MLDWIKLIVALGAGLVAIIINLMLYVAGGLGTYVCMLVIVHAAVNLNVWGIAAGALMLCIPGAILFGAFCLSFWFIEELEKI